MSFDPRPQWRDHIHETIGLAATHAGLAQTYCELGDDAGLAYALRSFALYAKATLETFNDLCPDNRRMAEAERTEARPSPARGRRGHRRRFIISHGGACCARRSRSQPRAGAWNMIDLYALTSPNVQKIYIALEELELPYREHFVDVWKGEQFAPEFVRLNPNSKIPVIVDRDGPDGKPLTVFESGAILLYLADKTRRLLPERTRERFEVIQWLMIQLTGIGPAFGNNVHFARFAPAGNDYSVSRFRTEMLRLYDVLEKRLGEAPFLGGMEYSIADIATFPWTRNHDAHGVGWAKFPNLARWFRAVDGRPAVQRALAKVAKITSSKDAASPADLDRIFGRGVFAR